MNDERTPRRDDPHGAITMYSAGMPLHDAKAALVMLHGRGATADDILGLARYLPAADLAYLAPQAAGNTWYPQRFLAPLDENEPWLSSALAAVGRVLAQVAAAGIPTERTFLLGFSQGACLALEYVAREPRRWGGLAALSGGIIGPPGAPRPDPPEDRPLSGMPVYLGCDERDLHIPATRVRESAELMRRLGATVTLRLYRSLGHTINDDELASVRDMLA